MSVTIPGIPVVATFILSTDLFEISSGGTSKQIAWSKITESDNLWEGDQLFQILSLRTAGSTSVGGVFNLVGDGAGDMSCLYQGVQGTGADIRVGTQMQFPVPCQTGIDNFPGAAEHVIVGEGNLGGNVITRSPYTRIEYGWQSSNPGWYAAMHQESGWMPDTIPAPGGKHAKPMSFGIADHTNTQYNHHVMASSTDGPLVDDFTSIGGSVTPLSGNRTFVMGAWFFGIRPLAGNPTLYQYDGTEQFYLQPPVPTTVGHHDSHTGVWAGTWNAGGGPTDYHVADWRPRVNVSDNAGTNKYVLEARTDNNAYTSRLELPFTIPVLATGAAHTVDDIITFLQGLKLCKQA